MPDNNLPRREKEFEEFENKQLRESFDVAKANIVEAEKTQKLHKSNERGSQAEQGNQELAEEFTALANKDEENDESQK